MLELSSKWRSFERLNSKWRALERLSIAIIQGTEPMLADFKVTPNEPLPGETRHRRSTLLKALKLIRGTTLTIETISQRLSLPVGTVSGLSRLHFKQTGGKWRIVGENVRKPTGFFTEQQIEAWVREFWPKISKKAFIVLQLLPRGVEKFSQRELADKIADEVRRRLTIFDISNYPNLHFSKYPGQMNVRTGKLGHLNNVIGGHVVRGAEYGARRVWTRLVKRKIPTPPKRQRGIPAHQRRERTRQQPDLSQVDVALGRNGLNPKRRVLVLAHLAGLTDKQVYTVLGVSRKAISDMRRRIVKDHGIPLEPQRVKVPKVKIVRRRPRR